ncbi:MAG: ABC transporter ATP-binding protein [Rickettsiales bacterium]|nr:MAG: ABC transporter ATP-binding protein [Rickettsiales bacterium]
MELKKKEISILKSLSPFLLRYKWSLLGYFFISYLLREFVNMVVLRYMWSDIINSLIVHTFSFDTNFWFLTLYVLLIQFGPFSGILSTKMRYNLFIDMDSFLIRYYYEKLLKNSIGFFNDNMAGTLNAKIARLCSNFTRSIDEIMQVILAIIMTIITGIILIKYNYQLAIFLFLWSIIYSFSLLYFLINMKKLSIEVSDMDSELHGKMIDSFSNILSTKIFVKENFEKGNIKKGHILKKQKQHKRYMYDIGRRITDYFLIVSISAFSLFKLISMFLDNKINIGELIFIEGILQNVVMSIRHLADRIANITDYVGKIKSSLEVLENESTINDNANSKNIELKEIPAIEFKNVVFRYKENLPLVFENFNLLINAGEKVGLVGHTGSGKSSFVNLLLRFYDINDGAILIGGYDIKNDFTQKSLRKNISYIPQEPVLFHRTIRENLLYGDTKATEDELIDACKKAYCYDFILEMEEGFNTLVGERGVKLSGGQKQRIAIARAILKKSPVLILDEATSALDSITEHYIQKALDNLMKGKSVFVIAHRLSTLNNMDRIVVLQNGKVVEDGTKDELLSIKNGVFESMWSMQRDGVINF